MMQNQNRFMAMDNFQKSQEDEPVQETQSDGSTDSVQHPTTLASENNPGT
jgi:hypothetical protein